MATFCANFRLHNLVCDHLYVAVSEIVVESLASEETEGVWEVNEVCRIDF